MKLLFQSYADQLEQLAKKEFELERYEKEVFPLENELEEHIMKNEPTDLLAKMDITNDYKAAIALYEAYSDLSPIDAASHTFWTSLSHTTLFEYVRKRWPHQDSVADQNRILRKWFYAGGLNRNALASLWWGVYLTKDEKLGYELTKLYFSNFSFRNAFWGQSTLYRYKAATLGVLDFFYKYRDNDNYKLNEARGRFITKYFNQLGAVKRLAAMPREFFSEEMERIKEEIKNAKIIKPNNKKDLDPEDHDDNF